MKIRSIHLKYFKRFRDRLVDFTDPDTGQAKNLVVLIGKNGAGKSTILQAIAATLGTATKQLENPSDLEWPGFDLELADKTWQLPGQVDISVEFNTDEREAVREFVKKVPGLSDRGFTPPGDFPEIKLTLQSGKVQTGNPPQKFQFLGREYAKQIFRLVPEGADVFKRVGGVFWYTEIRNATSLVPFIGEKTTPTLSLMRSRLIDLFYFHLSKGAGTLSPGQRDVYVKLEKAYQMIFPSRNFEGATPQTEIGQIFGEPHFYLYDHGAKKQYELSEMSGGERAVFPLIFDFANWEIHNSVILIDELELHLYPPMQQSLLRALKHLGQNNQFIITTHSDAIESIVHPDNIIRLEGGD